jgi:hypothetical protein
MDPKYYKKGDSLRCTLIRVVSFAPGCVALVGDGRTRGHLGEAQMVRYICSTPVLYSLRDHPGFHLPGRFEENEIAPSARPVSCEDDPDIGNAIDSFLFCNASHG